MKSTLGPRGMDKLLEAPQGQHSAEEEQEEVEKQQVYEYWE